METLENQKSENLRKALEKVVKEDPSMPITAIDLSESPEDFDGKEHKYSVFYGTHFTNLPTAREVYVQRLEVEKISLEIKAYFKKPSQTKSFGLPLTTF